MAYKPTQFSARSDSDRPKFYITTNCTTNCWVQDQDQDQGLWISEGPSDDENQRRYEARVAKRQAKHASEMHELKEKKEKNQFFRDWKQCLRGKEVIKCFTEIKGINSTLGKNEGFVLKVEGMMKGARLDKEEIYGVRLVPLGTSISQETYNAAQSFASFCESSREESAEENTTEELPEESTTQPEKTAVEQSSKPQKKLSRKAKNKKKAREAKASVQVPVPLPVSAEAPTELQRTASRVPDQVPVPPPVSDEAPPDFQRTVSLMETDGSVGEVSTFSWWDEDVCTHPTESKKEFKDDEDDDTCQEVLDDWEDVYDEE